MMRRKIILFICLALLMISCRSADTPQTPLDTLKTYLQAIKKKDVSKMKALLSEGSIKMATEEAKAQNIAVDEVILRETLFTADQKTLKFRNEKIDGDNATIEVETSPNLFDRVPFVKENGIWKIAKDKFADEIQKQSDEEMKKLDDKINEGRQEN
ncbi:MAG TPA: hypothetical protein PKY82_09610 [Pyrinomonadaceae bacterium]|nr:hypothetical protein [Pyrinomonadaceae bacterium]